MGGGQIAEFYPSNPMLHTTESAAAEKAAILRRVYVGDVHVIVIRYVGEMVGG